MDETIHQIEIFNDQGLKVGDRYFARGHGHDNSTILAAIHAQWGTADPRVLEMTVASVEEVWVRPWGEIRGVTPGGTATTTRFVKCGSNEEDAEAVTQVATVAGE